MANNLQRINYLFSGSDGKLERLAKRWRTWRTIFNTVQNVENRLHSFAEYRNAVRDWHYLQPRIFLRVISWFLGWRRKDKYSWILLIQTRLFWIAMVLFRTQNHFRWICRSVFYYRRFRTLAFLSWIFVSPESAKWRDSTVVDFMSIIHQTLLLMMIQPAFLN